jgi:hypothetical protein
VIHPDVDGLQDQGDAGAGDVRCALGEDLDQLVQLVLPLPPAEAGSAAHHDPGAAELLRYLDAGIEAREEGGVVLGRDHELHPGFGKLGGEVDPGFLEGVLEGGDVLAGGTPHFDCVKARGGCGTDAVGRVGACF